MKAALQLILCCFPAIAAADHWSDQNLEALRQAPMARGGKKVEAVSLAQLAALPKVIDGSPTAVFVVVKTSEGDWCKLLLRSGGLKVGSHVRSLLVIERLTTYAANPRRGIKADKRDIYLFDGFGIDLDLGQVVPTGSGEDLVFRAGIAVPDKADSKREEM